MRYCRRCVYPENHALGLSFNEAGICSGCIIHEEKDILDWPERMQRLRKLVEGYRSQRRRIHDCVVPVSGARDSYFIVHVVTKVLGLRPLLVSYNKHYNTETGIRNLAYLRTLFGCDYMQSTVSPDRAKRITRETLRLRASMYWHCLAGQTAFPVQVAVKFKIPLIIWGAHQGVDQVGMYSHLDEVEMTRKYREEHDLMGLDEDELLAQAECLAPADTEAFRYPHDKEIEAIGVRGIYLNNYLRWDTKAQHEHMIAEYGYETLPQQRTFDKYNDADCHHYSGLHDLLKFRKLGFGKVTDHACREIRFGRLTRGEGIEMVERYRDVEPEDQRRFLDWAGVDQSTLDSFTDGHRDPRVWRKRERQWQLLDTISNHRSSARIDGAQRAWPGSCVYIDSRRRAVDRDTDGYVLIGRGWVDPAEPPAKTGGLSRKADGEANH